LERKAEERVKEKKESHLGWSGTAAAHQARDSQGRGGVGKQKNLDLGAEAEEKNVSQTLNSYEKTVKIHGGNVEGEE